MKTYAFLCFLFLPVFAMAHLIDEGKVPVYAYPEDLKDEHGGKTPRGVVADILPATLEDLAFHLETMAGEGVKVEFREVSSASEVGKRGIVLGKLAVEWKATPPASEEGFHLLREGDLVLIGATTHRGIAHGLYTLLREMGCDWVMPGERGLILPDNPKLALPAKLDRKESPSFPHRNIWYRGGPKIVSQEDRVRFAEWCRRQRLGFPESERERGAGHAWDRFIKRHQAAFDADPTMYALVRMPDGTLQRRGPQLDPSNPKVADLWAEEIREEFKKNGWPHDRLARFAIGPADGGGYSISPEAQALGSGENDPIIGETDSTDQVVYLANEVLRRIEKEYPNVTLSYLCYSVHQLYPSVQKPHPKINVVFAPIAMSRLHHTGDPKSKTRMFYQQVLDQWAKDGERTFGFYEYNWNLADNMLPFTRIRMMGEDIPMYHRMGVRWAIIECTKAWSINGAHDYIAARLLWDARADWRGLLDEYCQKAFGAAAPAVKRYLLRMADRQREAGQEVGSFFVGPLVYDEAYVKEAEADFAEALKATLSPAERTRVEDAQLPLVALSHYLAWYRALNRFDFPAAQAAYDAMQAHWQASYERHPDLVAGEVPSYLNGMIGMTTRDALKYSSAPYRMLLPLDDELRTSFDPGMTGEKLHFHGPEINDDAWVRTKTFSSSWDAQGLGFIRSGAVWYRFPFELPEGPLEEKVGLFLGGFDDRADVWLNGQRVNGDLPVRKYVKPMVYDLTPYLRKKGRNVLAIRISRISQMNENLTGGLLRPGYLFTGPTIETETAPAQPERVLPGAGGVETAK